MATLQKPPTRFKENSERLRSFIKNEKLDFSFPSPLFRLFRWLEAQAKNAERPSVLLINVDDWNDWNSVLKGHSQAISPNIERFAKKGVTFSNAICASPSCVPSRPALFTGIAPSRSGNISNDSGKRPWRFYASSETITIPKLFSQNGWTSISVAKNFHRGDGPEFDTYIPPFKTPKKLKKVGINLNSSAIWDIADMPVSEMGDYKAASMAIKTIQSQEGPLLLSVGIYRPHVPWIVLSTYLICILKHSSFPSRSSFRFGRFAGTPEAGCRIGSKVWKGVIMKSWSKRVTINVYGLIFGEAFADRLGRTDS